MPEEPKQPIEELLEAHALRRRAEGGQFELHEATRHLLRGEALRHHRPEATVERSAPARSAWFFLWTRLAGAFGFVALAGLAVLVIQQLAPPHRSDLARLEPTATSSRSILAAPGSTIAPAALSKAILPAGSSLSVTETAPAAPASIMAADRSRDLSSADLRQSPSPAPVRVASLAAETRDSKMEAKAKSMTVPAANAPPTSAALAAGPLLGTVFRRVETADGLRRNLQSPRLPSVLKSFNASLLGNRLRLEEADGSVYLGDVDPSDGAFSLVGTNRATGLVVRFSGHATMAPALVGLAGVSRTGSAVSVPKILEGTVALGDRQQWRLRAEARP